MVLPTYHYGPFLPKALASCFNQSYENIEILVVDDGSTDDTREVLENYGDRVQYVYQANSGVSAPRNKGVMLAL